jgi:hypothetical protein
MLGVGGDGVAPGGSGSWADNRRDRAEEAERGEDDEAKTKTKTMTKTRGLNAHVLLPEHLSSREPHHYHCRCGSQA